MIDVLIGCESSGVFREAFRALGYNAWSCDLLPADDGSHFHIQDDIRNQLNKGWHLAIMHPTCTRMTNAGVRWLHTPPPNKTTEQMWKELDEGCALFSDCLNADIPCKAIENPVMHKHAKKRIENYYEFTQSVQPWQFSTQAGDEDDKKKRTCWWLHNLPKLEPLGILDGSTASADVHLAAPSADRWKIRSKSHAGMAKVAALTWGKAAAQFSKAV